MNREHWAAIKQVFYAALEVPSSERDAFVVSASKGDLSIQSEVELLLKADREAGSYLENPFLAGHDEPSAPYPVSLGDVLCGRFQILRAIGEGGMGHVFEALDSELAVNVALKVIRSEIASNPDALARFRQEVRLARRITHPNVCRTFDIERQTRAADAGDARQDIVFFTMEFLEGETLDARIKRDGPIPAFEAIRIAREIAEALQAAHKLGIAHRDLKPSNIMLVPVGSSTSVAYRAVVTDFGLAHFEPAVSSSAPGNLPGLDPAVRPSGTLAYMSPEQLENAPVSSATDIYALGLILFEMATGKRAFPADRFLSGMALRLSGYRQLPELQIPDLPPLWRSAIEGCLRADPAERFQSAAEVIKALEGRSQVAIVSGDGLESRTVPSSLDTNDKFDSSLASGRNQTQGATRRPWIVAAVIGTTLLVIAASMTLVLKHRRQALLHDGNQSASTFKILPVVSAPGEVDSPTFSPDGRAIAYLWDGGGQPHSDVYIFALGAASPLRLTHTKSGVIGHPAWSSDGKQIAFSRCDGNNDGIFVAPSTGGEERKLTSAACMQAEPGRVAWLPSSDRILIVDRCSPTGPFGVILFSLVTDARQCLTNSGPLQNADVGFDFALSPDGKTIAFTPAPPAIRCEVYTIPLYGGIPKRLTDGAQCWGELMWSPDGQSILFSSTRTTLFTLCRVSVDGGPIEHAIRYQQVGSFTKDGRRLAYAERSGGDGPDVWRADLASAGGSVLVNRKLIKIQSEEKDAQPSPDGSRIVWMSWRTGNAEIWTSRADGENPLQLSHLGTYAGTPRWSPDGKFVAFDGLTNNGTQVFVMDAEGRNLHPITTGPYDNVVPSWSRDGRSIYFASSRTGIWQVWRHALASGTEAQITKEGGFDSFESPDGRTVFFSKFDKAGIWNISKTSGAETLVVADKPQFGFWGQWAVTRPGLYLLDDDASPRPRIEFYNFATRRTSPVFTLAENPKRLQPGLSATMDGKSVYYTQYTEDDVIQMMEFSQ